MIRFLLEIQGKYKKLAKIVKISISFNRLVFPLKFNRFSQPLTLTVSIIDLDQTYIYTVNTKSLHYDCKVNNLLTWSTQKRKKYTKIQFNTYYTTSHV